MCHSLIHYVWLMSCPIETIGKNEMALIFNHIMFPFRLYFRFQCHSQRKWVQREKVNLLSIRLSTENEAYTLNFHIILIFLWFVALHIEHLLRCKDDSIWPLSVKTSQCVYQMLRWNIECSKNKPIPKKEKIHIQ